MTEPLHRQITVCSQRTLANLRIGLKENTEPILIQMDQFGLILWQNFTLARTFSYKHRDITLSNSLTSLIPQFALFALMNLRTLMRLFIQISLSTLIEFLWINTVAVTVVNLWTSLKTNLKLGACLTNLMPVITTWVTAFTTIKKMTWNLTSDVVWLGLLRPPFRLYKCKQVLIPWT